MTIPEFKSAPAKVRLVPWDPENQQHVERLYHQRIACTWKSEMIGKWQEEQRKGVMSIHWVVIDDSDPEKDRKNAQHVKQYPVESEPLEDTAQFLNGQPRSVPADAVPFIPVGHISLDTGNLTDPSVDTVEKDIFWITTLYVSRAMQKSGLGRASMDAIELMATQAPWKARYLGLDTLDKDFNHPSFEDGRAKRPDIVNQAWYERRGYEVFKKKPAGYTMRLSKDVEFEPVLVFMKKKVEGTTA